MCSTLDHLGKPTVSLALGQAVGKRVLNEDLVEVDQLVKEFFYLFIVLFFSLPLYEMIFPRLVVVVIFCRAWTREELKSDSKEF